MKISLLEDMGEDGKEALGRFTSKLPTMGGIIGSTWVLKSLKKLEETGRNFGKKQDEEDTMGWLR